MDFRLNIPASLDFSALQLDLDQASNGFEFNYDTLALVCTASGLSIEGFENQDDGDAPLLRVIASWYALHRAQGGYRHEVAELLTHHALKAGEG